MKYHPIDQDTESDIEDEYDDKNEDGISKTVGEIMEIIKHKERMNEPKRHGMFSNELA